MIARFTNLEDYLAELRDVMPTSSVRASIKKESINEGGSKIVVVSGFFEDECFYAATLSCGEHWQGGPNDAQSTAKDVVQKIREVCDEKGVTLRGGTWQAP